MAADYVQLATDGTGKRMATDTVTEAGNTVHRQRVIIDSAALPTGSATEATLAQVLAGLASDPSTETTALAILAKLSADPATQTTLAAVLAKLPASLGIKTSAASLSTAPASDAVFVATPPIPTLVSVSGTIAAGGSAQNAAAANPARKGFCLQNQSSGNLWFTTLAAAIQGQPSILLAPGAFYETPPGGQGTGAISVIGGTTGQAFAGREW